jgi:succinylarginine dihydrolase
MTQTFEINFDGLPGPTHTYSGLAFGDKASMTHAKMVSNPKACALQSLEQMRLCVSLGLKQAILPPHERPALFALQDLGFYDHTPQIFKKLLDYSPEIFLSVHSASAMWAANAAIVTPSCDTADTRVHFTPANLAHEYHRSLEASFTAKLLQQIFFNDNYFVHHPPLSSGTQFSDEGAANHTRLSETHGKAGVHVFVYGGAAFADIKKPKQYPARQNCEASQAIARRHGILEKSVFLQQNPEVIDKGVFHNDVIATGNENIFIYHEEAFVDADKSLIDLSKNIPKLNVIKILNSDISVEKAVETYVFNSQVVTMPNKKMAIIAPKVCENDTAAFQTLQKIINSDKRFSELFFVDCSHSVNNGGGPACLRLRVVLAEEELAQIHGGVMLNESKIDHLIEWVNKYYRDRLTVQDFLDPNFHKTNMAALDELTQILQLGNVYPFQL